MKPLSVLDSTLRDGAQGVDVSFSVNDKLAIVGALDAYGVSYIEAGNPASNPKDLEFFERARSLTLRHAKLVAFGATRRHDSTPEHDANLTALLAAHTLTVAIFGKAWDLHVTDILRVTREENLAMIASTVAYLKAQGREVIFDAEHYFDGYAADPAYALAVLEAAAAAGADVLCLCDTNGGTLPLRVYRVVGETRSALEPGFPHVPLGIHTHNDGGCAVANTLVAVEAGAVHVQGTFIGFGERCGNADLSSVLPSLALKGRDVATQDATPRKAEASDATTRDAAVQQGATPREAVPSAAATRQSEVYAVDGDLTQLTQTAQTIAQIANVQLSPGKPYVGRGAFSHKAGMHIDGVLKNRLSFEHIDPERVGNKRRFLMSEVAGRGSVLEKIKPYAPDLTRDDPRLAEIITRLKEMEHAGYQFEAADASFELLTRRVLGTYVPHFSLIWYKTMGEFPAPAGELQATATIKIEVDGTSETTAAMGKGPVNALDNALRKALCVFYPHLSEMHLSDFKVRVLDQKAATAAKVRVLIESSDAMGTWTTIGVSDDIIEASLDALVDSIEYKLSKVRQSGKETDSCK